ncbi:MAG: outer membrane beta-barrel protein [Ferruginibacter sp.]|nr:outer membrane beta-barrel protein [Cytophagales bacterium]
MRKYCLLSIGLLGLIQAGYGQAARKDSVVVLFGQKTRMIIVSDEKGGVRELQKYDFNEILKDVGIFLEDAQNRETYLYINETTGRRYLKDTTVVVSERETSDDEEEAETDAQDTTDTDDDGYGNDRWSGYLDLGLNNYLENRKFPDQSDAPYGLRPWGSRHVALGSLRNFRVGGRKSPLYLRAGLEVSWHNFMFDGDNQARKTPTGTDFPAPRPDLQKSKLTVCYLNVPAMVALQFRNRDRRETFYLAAGGYVGYRLGSYTKIKYETEGQTRKERAKGNFYLNNVRYGLTGQVGIDNVALFAKYDLNSLFVDDRGPRLNVLSFGITLTD